MRLNEVKKLLHDIKKSIIQCNENGDEWRAVYLRNIRRKIKARIFEHYKISNLPQKDL